MIAATSPQQVYRSNQSRISEHPPGLNFARSAPSMWEIGRSNAIRGPLSNAENHEIMRREPERDLYRVMHQPPQPLRNDAIDWKHKTSLEGPYSRHPSDARWSQAVNAPPMRHSSPAWNVHPRVPMDVEQSENAVRRAQNPSVRGFYPGVQYQQQQQHWHRFLEARHNGKLERSSQGHPAWSTTGTNVPSLVIPSAETSTSALQLNDNYKRPLSSVQMNSNKMPRGLNKLDLLCSATLEIGPLHDNPMGCSCPKSKCVALYCDCFKAGRRCNPSTCSCLDCKNTIAESGPHGARTAAIRSILARNPRAFTNAGVGTPKVAPGQVACNCIRSKCLKLYCSCFQNGKVCDTKVCTCVDCFNTLENPMRKQAVELCLEKRPDAFVTRTREPGLGCACKNNRCIRKYCDCFRSSLPCSSRCSCRQCANTDDTAKHRDTREDELEKKDSAGSPESRLDSISV
jgi:hypothetical protein